METMLTTCAVMAIWGILGCVIFLGGFTVMAHLTGFFDKPHRRRDIW